MCRSTAVPRQARRPRSWLRRLADRQGHGSQSAGDGCGARPGRIALAIDPESLARLTVPASPTPEQRRFDATLTLAPLIWRRPPCNLFCEPHHTGSRCTTAAVPGFVGQCGPIGTGIGRVGWINKQRRRSIDASSKMACSAALYMPVSIRCPCIRPGPMPAQRIKIGTAGNA